MASIVNFRPVPKPTGTRRALDRSQAEAMAIEVLGYVASDDDTLAAFIHAAGFNPKDLRKMPRRQLLVGVADFLLGSDDLIGEYADRMGIDAEMVAGAARLISPPH